jgi:hypothetical protein
MPPPYTYLNVVGTYTSPDGTAVAGDIRFVPSDPTANSATPVSVPANPITVTLDGSGQFSTYLLVTDDANTTPTGWVWRVSELFAGGREWDFELPSALTEPVDISTLSPATATATSYSYVTSATFATLEDRVTSVEETAGLALAAIVIHPFLLAGI